MVDNLLDLLTGGEHRKTKRILEERRRLREEEERIRQLLEGKPVAMQGVHDDKMHQMPNFQQDIKVDFGALKSLSELGIDTKFLDIVGKLCTCVRQLELYVIVKICFNISVATETLHAIITNNICVSLN